MTGTIDAGDGSPARPGASRSSADHRADLAAARARSARLDRDWAFGDGRRRRRHGRDRRLGRRGRPPGGRRRARGGASGSSSTARTRRSSTTRRSTSSATGRPAPGSSTRLAPGARHRLGPGPRARQPGQGRARSRPASSGRSTQGAGVINLSLSSRSDALFGVFHDLADRAYFANVLLVCAANNVAVASYPSLFAAVVSVAAHDVRDPGRLVLQPARRRSSSGRTGSTSTSPGRAAAGSSRPATASPRRTSPGYAARIRATHPGASPFEVKTILAATADAATEPTDRPAADGHAAGQRNAPSAGRRGVDMAKDVEAFLVGVALDVVLVDEFAAGRRPARGEVAAGAGIDGQVVGRQRETWPSTSFSSMNSPPVDGRRGAKSPPVPGLVVRSSVVR